MIKNPRRALRGRQSGSILALMMVVVAVIGVVTYMVMRLMAQVMDTLSDEDSQVEAQMLASDLKEYTKYLIAYEKLVFVQNPLRITADRQAKLEALWGQGYGAYDMSKSVNMINVCGGYTVAARFVGNLSLGSGDHVFCPAYLRDPNNTGKQTEDMLLNQWANANRDAMVLQANAPTKTSMGPTFQTLTDDGTRFPDGQYRVRLEYSKDDKQWYANANNTVAIEAGQNLFVFVRQANLKYDVSANVDIDIFTDSFGMKSDFTERYIRVTSRVTMDTAAKGKRIFIDQESFVLRIPTIKDFAIFVPYPTTASGQPTRSSQESLKLGATSTVNGRVYFNGDIDTPLSELPTFLEPVFISGRLLTPVKNTDATLYRQKFRRGLITNLSMSRYLFDGKCPSGTANPSILNGTGLLCNNGNVAYKIDDYLNALKYVCRCAKLTVGANGTYTHGALLDTCVDIGYRADYCPNQLGFVKNGYDEVEVSSAATHAFIASPVKKLVVKRSGSTIMGVIVGGYIDSSVGANFVGITAMKPGMPGLGDQTTLSARTTEVNALGGGIGAPIPNLPLVQFVKDGFK